MHTPEGYPQAAITVFVHREHFAGVFGQLGWLGVVFVVGHRIAGFPQSIQQSLPVVEVSIEDPNLPETSIEGKLPANSLPCQRHVIHLKRRTTSSPAAAAGETWNREFR
jgi:hypothetical protein